jgi:hypothetical protein
MEFVVDVKEAALRARCKEKALFYEAAIRKLRDSETEVLEKCRKEPWYAPLLLWPLSNNMLDLASNYLVINGISLNVSGRCDDIALADAKKAVFKAIFFLGKIVTDKIESPFSEYEEKLARLEEISAQEKYDRVRKLGAAIALVKNAYHGDEAQRWAFVDIEGRFCAIAKNLFDIKGAFAPGSPSYEPLKNHQQLILKLLKEQARHYQERFSAVSKRAEDMRHALVCLDALRHFYEIRNIPYNAEELKRKHDLWSKVYQKVAKQVHGS